MRLRIPVSRATVAAVIAVVSFWPVSVAGQSLSDPPANWTVPRTADGRPDLQGVWSNNGTTPLERPEVFAGRTELTDEEVAQIERRAQDILNGTDEQAGDVLGDSLYRQAVDDPSLQRFDAVTGNYNTFWIADRSFDNRTSLIVDPSNGHIPPLTEEALARRRSAVSGFARFLNPEGPEDTGLTVRCISYGVPNLLTGYNSYFQIAQTPSHVVILQELVHDARVIPLDGRPHLGGNLRQWHGDPRSHWDGDTLVVETTNYSATSSRRGGSDDLRVVERFTRVGPDTIRWDVTYDDPSTWPQPWTAAIALHKSDGDIFEYACHEGNYAMEGILAGARQRSARTTALKEHA